MVDISRFDTFIKKATDQKKLAHKNVKQAFKDFSKYKDKQLAESDLEKKPKKRRNKPKQPEEDFKDERLRIDGDERVTE